MVNTLIEKIIQNPLFLRLKEVVENNPWHDFEDAYSHSVKTKDIAQKEITGDFISNPEAKKLFQQFVDEDFHEMKRADIMILIALTHDIGKILNVKEGNKIRPIRIEDAEGLTSLPGHEYWGSTIVSKVLEDLSLDAEIVSYITKGVKVHDGFQGDYLVSRKDWLLEKLINDIKSRAEGLYIESMFNNYCDVFTAVPFQPYKDLVIKIFNDPSLYERREYVLHQI